MIRGFVTGAFWGGVVAVAAMAVVSQIVPLPQPPSAGNGPGEGGAPVVAVPETEPEPVLPVPNSEAAPEEPPVATEEMKPEILEKGPQADAPEAQAEPGGATVPVAEGETATAIAGGEAEAEGTTERDGAPVQAAGQVAPPSAMTDAPAVALAPAPGAGAASAPTVPVPERMPPLAMAMPDAPATPGPDTAPAVLDPVPAAPAERDDPLLRSAEEGTAAGLPRLITPVEPLPRRADGGLAEAGAGAAAREERTVGVTTDRLPRIGDPAPAEEVVPSTEAAPDTGDDLLLGTTPLELFARPFENPEGRPLFSILLIDEGASEAERRDLAALAFPITFVLDPLRPDVAEAARIYRDAGQEVAMLATGLPDGATAADMEQSFQALDLALPEAVAVVDPVSGGFQDRLDLARQAVPIVAEQGRGLLTHDRGLNPADQVARREGVPSAVIFRVLDQEGESIPRMRNYLDRAAFKAAQEGRVIVIGRIRPQTVAAILEWTVEGRAGGVALAPVSAMLARPDGG